MPQYNTIRGAYGQGTQPRGRAGRRYIPAAAGAPTGMDYISPLQTQMQAPNMDFNIVGGRPNTNTATRAVPYAVNTRQPFQRGRGRGRGGRPRPGWSNPTSPQQQGRGNQQPQNQGQGQNAPSRRFRVQVSARGWQILNSIRNN